MAWHKQGRATQIADRKMGICFQQMIKLRPIRVKVGLKIKNTLKDLLHCGNVVTDCGLAAEGFFQIRGCRQMVCMGMSDYCLFYWPPRVNKEVSRRAIQPRIGEFKNSHELVNKPILPNTSNV